MRKLQITGKQGNANNWGSRKKREVEQEERITAWRSSGLPRAELNGKSVVSLKGWL